MSWPVSRQVAFKPVEPNTSYLECVLTPCIRREPEPCSSELVARLRWHGASAAAAAPGWVLAAKSCKLKVERVSLQPWRPRCGQRCGTEACEAGVNACPAVWGVEKGEAFTFIGWGIKCLFLVVRVVEVIN